MSTVVTSPIETEFDWRRVRGVLAERQIAHSEFADKCGLGRTHVSRLLNGFPAGELARIKLARGLAALGLDGRAAHDYRRYSAPVGDHRSRPGPLCRVAPGMGCGDLR